MLSFSSQRSERSTLPSPAAGASNAGTNLDGHSTGVYSQRSNPQENRRSPFSQSYAHASRSSNSSRVSTVRTTSILTTPTAPISPQTTLPLASKVQLKSSYLTNLTSGKDESDTSPITSTSTQDQYYTMTHSQDPIAASIPRAYGGRSMTTPVVDYVLSTAPSWRVTDTSFDTYMNGLNPSQREAVLAPLQPLLILASAGSGKTKTLISRISHCLRKGVPASSVLAITFTRKATHEIQDRVSGQIGLQAGSQISVCNFHQLALRILRRHYGKLGFANPFLLIGASEQKQHIRQAVEMWVQARQQASHSVDEWDEAIPELIGGLQGKRLRALADRARVQDEAEMALIESAIGEELGQQRFEGQNQHHHHHHSDYGNLEGLSQIQHTQSFQAFDRSQSSSFSSISSLSNDSRPGSGNGNQAQQMKQLVESMLLLINDAKRRGLGPLAFEGHERAIFGLYNDLLKRACALDFSDLVPLACKLLQDFPEVLNECRHRFRYVFVDEFQDISREQWKFLKLLLNASDPTSCPAITCVGDDDQAIFRFRGGSGYSFASFVKTFQGRYQVIPLLQTYRSTSKIVSAASALVSWNNLRYPKLVWTANASGSNIQLLAATSLDEEAMLVANEMEKLHTVHGIPYGHMAILSRTRAVLRPFQEVIKSRNLCAVTTTSSTTLKPLSREIFTHSVTLDVLAYLELVAAGGDVADDAFKRVLNRPSRKLGPRVLATLERGVGANGIQSLLAEAHRVVTKDELDLTGPQRLQLTNFLRIVRAGRMLCKALDAHELPGSDDSGDTLTARQVFGEATCQQLSELKLEPEKILEFMRSKRKELLGIASADSTQVPPEVFGAHNLVCVILVMVCKAWGMDFIPNFLMTADAKDQIEPAPHEAHTSSDRKRSRSAKAKLSSNVRSNGDDDVDADDDDESLSAKKRVQSESVEVKSEAKADNAEVSSSTSTEKAKDAKERFRLVVEALLLRALYFGEQRQHELAVRQDTTTSTPKLLQLRKELTLFVAQCRDARATESYVTESNRTMKASEDATALAAKKQASVTLSTIHQAKGLEWSVVFFVHVNSGHIPCGVPAMFAKSAQEMSRNSKPRTGSAGQQREETKGATDLSPKTSDALTNEDTEFTSAALGSGSEAESQAIQTYLERLQRELSSNSNTASAGIIKKLLARSRLRPQTPSPRSEETEDKREGVSGNTNIEEDDDEDDDSMVILRLLQRLQKKRQAQEDDAQYDELLPDHLRPQVDEEDLLLNTVSDEDLQSLLNEAWTRELNSRMEEERRLAYVACTRAREHLYVTYAMNENESPSTFLDELPTYLVSRDAPIVLSRGGQTSGQGTVSTSYSRSSSNFTTDDSKSSANSSVKTGGIRAMYLSKFKKPASE